MSLSFGDRSASSNGTTGFGWTCRFRASGTFTTTPQHPGHHARGFGGFTEDAKARWPEKTPVTRGLRVFIGSLQQKSQRARRPRGSVKSAGSSSVRPLQKVSGTRNGVLYQLLEAGDQAGRAPTLLNYRSPEGYQHPNRKR